MSNCILCHAYNIEYFVFLFKLVLQIKHRCTMFRPKCSFLGGYIFVPNLTLPLNEKVVHTNTVTNTKIHNRRKCLRVLFEFLWKHPHFYCKRTLSEPIFDRRKKMRIQVLVFVSLSQTFKMVRVKVFGIFVVHTYKQMNWTNVIKCLICYTKQ